jgi:cytochrome c oxidase subunit 4
MSQDPITKATYIKVYLALMILLAATVAAIYVNMGPFNILVTMVIAVTKALLVMLFFMHVRYSPRLIWLYAMLGVIWLTYLIGGTLADVLTRTQFAVPLLLYDCRHTSASSPIVYFSQI